MLAFFGILALVLAALVGLYWLWARGVEAEIADGAAHEWGLLKEHESSLIEGLDEARFLTVYRRVHFPRFPKYALATLVAFAAALPIVFAALVGVQLAADRMGLLPAPADVANRFLIDGEHMRLVTAAPSEAALYWAQDLAGFYYFFGLLIAWLIIVAVVMRRYHARRPGYLREEILRAKAE